MTVSKIEDLQVWQKSMSLVQAVYKLQKLLPKEEVYGLGDQIRRSAVSIPSNIAEGFGRNSDVDFVRFIGIAHGSLCELRTQLQLAEMLGYFTVTEEIAALIEEVGRLMRSLVSYLRKADE